MRLTAGRLTTIVLLSMRVQDARDSQKRRFDVIEPNVLDQGCGNAQATGGQKKRAT